ncbi:MAG: hypothetical protein AAB389_04190 [Patescibacteria group bacterium]
MKTIFLTAFTNFVVRNILDTEVLRILKSDPNLKIVILAPDEERDYLTKHFSSGNVVVEGVRMLPVGTTKALISFICRSLVKTYTTEMFAKLRYGRLEYFWYRFFLNLFAGREWFMKLMRFLDNFLLNKNRFIFYIEKYQPSLVFSTDITDRSTGESDIDLIREARHRGIPVIGMVRSWDNLTSRGIIRQVPDKILLHNEILKNECVKYHGISPEKIIVTGIPHYDNYLKVEKLSREEFYQPLGLDPRKKTVFFVVTADGFLEKQFGGRKPTINRHILELLTKLNPDKYQILVRFPLIGTVDLGDFRTPANMVFDHPGKLFGKGELDRDADYHLINSLYHCDVGIPGPSTIAADTLIFDKPLVVVGFDKEKDLPIEASMRKFLALEHLRPLTDLGAARIADSESELLVMLNQYLESPGLDAENRRKAIVAICWKLDGQASKRVADVILSAAQMDSPFE